MNKRMLATVLLVIFVCLKGDSHLSATEAAAASTLECPAVWINCHPLDALNSKWECAVSMKGADTKMKLTYNWWMSQGQIKSGQGTASMTVEKIDLSRGKEFYAAIKLGGLPEGCPDNPSVTIASGK